MKDIENKDEKIEKDEADSASENALTREVVSLAVVAYGERTSVTLGEEFSAKELAVPAADILFVNRYLSAKLIPVGLKYAVVYKVSDTEIALYEFYQNPDARDGEFDEKFDDWAKERGIAVTENDWDSFVPVRNGYQGFVFRETHQEYGKKLAEQSRLFSIGLTAAGVIMLAVGGTFIGLGKTSFGAIGLVLGALAAVAGVAMFLNRNKK